jgi:surfactin synthase thioesterase subunit
MTMPADSGLLAFFPSAGAGGSTQQEFQKVASARGIAYVAMPNPATLDVLDSGKWHDESIDEIRDATDRVSARYVILAGHCMGGLSAVRLADDLGSLLALPVRVLLVNTPCPDSSGLIPTMSQLPDAGIAEILTDGGFPQDLLDDEDMLAEIADGLRADAEVADRLAEWVSAVEGFQTLHVLSTRGDSFVPPAWCSGWQHRVSGEFQLLIADGGHSIDETSAGLLERAVDSVAASARAAPA